MPDSGHALVVRYGFRGLPGFLLGIAYLLSILAGFWGFFFEAAPPSVQAIIGFTLVSVLWNVSFILAGGIGLIARARKAPLTEVVAVEMIGSIFVAWAAMVFVGPQSNQAGIAFVAIALLMFGWAAGTRRYLAERKRVTDSIRGG
jgi:hypothetical protein